MEGKNSPENRRVRELEDIICTLKFELNGLKHVVSVVESEARTEREVMRNGFQQRVQYVVDWMNSTSAEVDKKADQITQLEEKVHTFLPLSSLFYLAY